jgi:hypothetical protein
MAEDKAMNPAEYSRKPEGYEERGYRPTDMSPRPSRPPQTPPATPPARTTTESGTSNP